MVLRASIVLYVSNGLRIVHLEPNNMKCFCSESQGRLNIYTAGFFGYRFVHGSETAQLMLVIIALLPDAGTEDKYALRMYSGLCWNAEFAGAGWSGFRGNCNSCKVIPLLLFVAIFM